MAADGSDSDWSSDAPSPRRPDDYDLLRTYMMAYTDALCDRGTLHEMATGFAALDLAAPGLYEAHRALELAPYGTDADIGDVPAAVRKIVVALRERVHALSATINRVTGWIYERISHVEGRLAKQVCEGVGATLFVMEGVLRRRVLACLLAKHRHAHGVVERRPSGTEVTLRENATILGAAADDGLKTEIVMLTSALSMLAENHTEPGTYGSTTAADFVRALDAAAVAAATSACIGAASGVADATALARARTATGCLAGELAMHSRTAGIRAAARATVV